MTDAFQQIELDPISLQRAEDDEFTVIVPERDTSITRSTADETAAFAVLTGDITDTQELLQNANTISNDLQRVGTSSALNDVYAKVRESNVQAIDMAMGGVLRDATLRMEDKTTLARDLMAQRRAPVGSDDLSKEALVNVLAYAKSPERDEQVRITDRQSKLGSVIAQQDALLKLVNNALADVMSVAEREGLTPDAVAMEIIGSAAGMLVPLQNMAMWEQTYKELFGKSAGAKIPVIGEMMKEVRNHLSSLQGQEKMDFAQQIIDTTGKFSGQFGYNQFLHEQALNAAFSDVLGRDPDKADWDRILLNVEGVLDAIALGGLARGVIATGKGIVVGKPLGTFLAADPNGNGKIALIEALHNPEVARLLGVTQEEAYSMLLPSFQGSLNIVAPGAVVEDMLRLQRDAQKLRESINFAHNYTDVEKAAAATRLTERLDAASTAGTLRSELSSVQALDDGIALDAVVGKTRNSGYVSVDELKAGIGELFGPDFANYTVYWKNPTNGLMEAWDSSKLLRVEDDHLLPEFFAKVKHTYQYDMSMMKVDELFFGRPVIEKGVLRNAFTSDPSAIFGRFINKVGINAYFTNKRVASDLNKMMFQRMAVLSNSDKIKVIDTIYEGSRLERSFNIDELGAKGLSQPQIMAYNAVRAAQDTQYFLEDQRVIRRMREQGMRLFTWEGSGFTSYAKPLRETVDEATGASVLGSEITGVKSAYDPINNAVITLTPTQVKELYARGGSLGRLYAPERVGNTQTKHILADADKFLAQERGVLTPPVRIGELPSQGVLNYRPGYVSRINKENYYIKRQYVMIEDGVENPYHAETVYVAATRKDAQRMADSLNSTAPKGESFSFEIDRNILNPALRETNQWDLLRATGGLKVGHRGERLTTIDGKLGEVDDMIGSIERGIRVTSQRLHDDAVASLKQRILNEYADVLPKTNGIPAIPADLDAIVSTHANSKRVQAVRTLLRQIQVLEGTTDPAVSKLRELMVRFAEWTEAVPGVGTGLSKTALWASRARPMNALAGATFNILLASNFPRQLLLGVSQPSFYVGLEPKYMATKMPYELAQLWRGRMAMADPDKWPAARASLAKSLGMTEKEAEAFIRGFKESGLTQTISEHTFVRDGMISLSHGISRNPAGVFLKEVEDIAKFPMIAARNVGFNAGEFSNKSISYLLAVKRFRDQNPGVDWTSKSKMAEIVADAEEFAFNMTQWGAFEYQRGWTKLMTQFMSHHHKAWLNILPQSVGGTGRYTGAEKARIAVGQFLMYGKNIWIGSEAYDFLRDKYGIMPDTPAMRWVEDGLVDGGVDMMLSAITGEDVDVALASSISPSGGVYDSFHTLISNLVSGNIPEVFAGASASAVGRVKDAILMSQYIWDHPNLDNQDKLVKTIQSFGSIAGVYDNWLKGEVARNVGYWVSRTGDPIVEAKYGDILMKQLFGVQPKAMEDYYNMLETMYGRPSGWQKSMADTYLERITSIVTKYADEMPSDPSDLYLSLMYEQLEVESMLFAVLNTEDAYAVKQELEILMKKKTGDVKGSTLVDNMTKIVARGHFGSNREYYFNKLKNSRMFTPEQQEVLKEVYDYSMGIGEELEEVYGN